MASKFLNLSFLTIVMAALPFTAHAQKVMPVSTGGNAYNMTSGPISVVIGPSKGARIRSLKYSGTELFYTDSSGSPSSNGSTFWPSPQAYWTSACKSASNNGCWPPPTNIDGSGAYTGGLLGDSSVTYAGSTDNGSGARLRKTLWVNSGDSSINIRYNVINGSANSISFGPWEITRFPGGGTTFFPIGLDTIGGTTEMLAIIRDTLGTKWYVFDSTKTLSGTPKFWVDGTGGWYAHVDKNRVLFVKKFIDTPPSKKAPVKESEVELYVQNNKTYQEMELQGPFGAIAAGDSITWNVKWLIRKLPDSVVIGRTSSLLNFTQQMVNAAAAISTPTGVRNAGISHEDLIQYFGNRIYLNLKKNMNVSLILMDSRGQTLGQIHSGKLSEGRHEFTFSTSLPQGVYLLVVRDLSSNKVLSKQALPLLKN